MSQHMQFDEKPERSGYRASSPPPGYQEPRFEYDDHFEGLRAEKLTPLDDPIDHSTRRVLRLMGLSSLALGLLILGFLLTFGASLSIQLTPTSPDVFMSAMFIFLGFWLLLDWLFLGNRRARQQRGQLLRRFFRGDQL
jgi:hypothetical protein